MDKSERELERELQNTQDEIRRELRRHRADQLRKKWNGSFLPREPLTQSMSALLGGPGSLLAANNIQDDLCFPEIVEIVLNANPNALGWVLSDVNARVGFLEGLAEHREVMHTSVNHWYNPPKRRGRKRSQTESGQDRNGEMFRRVCRDGEDPLLVSEDFAIRPGTLRQHLRRTRKQLEVVNK